MKKELENKLFEKYSKILPNGRNVDMRENLMCFGFSCGDGWYNILDTLFEKICEALGEENEIIMVQVKEKFGSLRVYFDHVKGNEEIYNKINDFISCAEYESSITCEICGKKGELKNDTGWVSTLCKKHRKERKEEWDG